MDKLTGVLTSVGTLTGTLSVQGTLVGGLSVPEARPYPEYEGPYQVTPKANESQTLETSYKLMTDDVTVDEVPYVETSNEYGTTSIIATE